MTAADPVAPERMTRLERIVRYYGPSVRHSMHIKLFLTDLIARPLPEPLATRARAVLYRWTGFQIGARVRVERGVAFVSNAPGMYDKLEIGDATHVSSNVTINLDDRVTIGNDVSIGPNVLIYTGSHEMGPSTKRMGKVVTRPVKIGDGARIGSGVILLPGVSVGSGSVVDQGAVVFRDVDPGCRVAGNPARTVQTTER